MGITRDKSTKIVVRGSTCSTGTTPPGVMATECRHSSGMAVDEQETIMMNRAMKKKEAWCDGHFLWSLILLGPTHFEGIKLDTNLW